MLTAATWPAHPDYQELALLALPDSGKRVLFVPPLFGEANKMRRFTVQAMHALAELGVGSVLPDLPGTNESLKPLSEQTISNWRDAVQSAAQHFKATHIVTVRSGAVCAPAGLPILSYAPQSGANLMRGMLRLHMISEREAGRETTSEQLDQKARESGLWIAGYDISPSLFTGLLEAQQCEAAITLQGGDLGGPGLWLRAEPSEAPEQSQRFADLIAEWAQ